MNKKKAEELRKLRKSEKKQMDFDENDELVLDGVRAKLIASYGPALETINGCLELMESMIIENNSSFPTTLEYKAVYIRLQELIADAEKEEVDVRQYKRRARELWRSEPVKYNSGLEDSLQARQIARDINKARKQELEKQKQMQGPHGRNYLILPVYSFDRVNGGMVVR